MEPNQSPEELVHQSKVMVEILIKQERRRKILIMVCFDHIQEFAVDQYIHLFT